MTIKTVTENRKVRHEYHILETYEAGIALTGTEVKSLRAGKANLQDSYARVENAELMLYNMHISPYEQGNQFNHEPKRTRRLLMHKQEIMRLLGKPEKGLALVPLKVYFKTAWPRLSWLWPEARSSTTGGRHRRQDARRRWTGL